MEVNLIVASGKNAGQKIEVSGQKFVIGRSKDCQLRPRSDLISRHHCEILIKESYVALRDFGSKNGTLVNGVRVETEQQLKTGDELQVGQLVFEVELIVSVSGKKKPKVNSIQEAALRTTQSNRSQNDLDLDSWLQDEDEDEEDLTLPARKEDTQTIDSTKADVEESTEKEPKKESDKQSGKTNSQEAASELLKKLFKKH